MVEEIGEEVEVTWVTTYQQANELKALLEKTDVASLDTETTPVPWYHEDFVLLCVSISIKEGHAYVIPVDHAHSETRSLIYSAIPYVAGQPLWVMQNGSFDYLALRQYGLTLRTPWFDTMAVQYMLDVEATKGLENLAQRWLGERPWKNIDYKHPELEDLETLGLLCARDAEVTGRLFFPMNEALGEDDQMWRAYHWLLTPAILALAEMEWNGVPIDLDRLNDLTTEVEDELETLLEDIRTLAGKPELNPNSTQQLSKVLFGDLGLAVREFTPGGAPSTAAAVLMQMRNDHQIIPMLQRYRELRKLLTASLLPWAEHASHDGKLHPRYKPAHVKTGRLASEMPNIQQVPRDKRVRSLFGGVPGYSIVELDYSQLELRIMAWLSGEERMLEAYQNGEDLHQLTADSLGVDRYTGKTANFGLLYGAGYRKLREIASAEYGLELTELQAMSIREQWFATYPMVPQFHEDMIAVARRDGGIRTLTGRWRPLPDIHSQDWGKKGGSERQAVNTPIQSVASDLTLSVLTDLVNDEELKAAGIQPIITVHDSILLLVPDGALEWVDHIALRMENPNWQKKFGIEIGVPLLVDVKIGKYWGEAT